MHSDSFTGFKSVPKKQEKTYRVDYDGMVGNIIGSYTTREGKKGVVLQQVGTKVVHVYNEARIIEVNTDE